MIKQVTAQLHDKNQQILDDQVHWEKYRATPDNVSAPSLLAYVNIELSAPTLNIQGANSRVVVASLLNLSQINNIERLIQWSIYDQFTLIAPSGEVLAGSLKPGQVLNEGVSFNRDGLAFKLTNPGPQHWTAIYVVSFKSFLDYTFWPLLCLAALALAGLLWPGLQPLVQDPGSAPRASSPCEHRRKRGLQPRSHRHRTYRP